MDMVPSRVLTRHPPFLNPFYIDLRKSGGIAKSSKQRTRSL